MELFKPQSKNKTAALTFLAFELIAFTVCFVYFVLSIVYAVQSRSFTVFIETFMGGAIQSAIIFGIGRIIDFVAPAKKETEKKEEKEEK